MFLGFYISCFEIFWVRNSHFCSFYGQKYQKCDFLLIFGGSLVRNLDFKFTNPSGSGRRTGTRRISKLLNICGKISHELRMFEKNVETKRILYSCSWNSPLVKFFHVLIFQSSVKIFNRCKSMRKLKWKFESENSGFCGH